MTDSFTKRPIKVSIDGDARPYLMVQLDQLDAVTQILDEAAQPFAVDEDAISLDGAPLTAIIDLGRHAGVESIQRRLDQAQDPRKGRRGDRRNVHRG